MDSQSEHEQKTFSGISEIGSGDIQLGDENNSNSLVTGSDSTATEPSGEGIDSLFFSDKDDHNAESQHLSSSHCLEKESLSSNSVPESLGGNGVAEQQQTGETNDNLESRQIDKVDHDVESHQSGDNGECRVDAVTSGENSVGLICPDEGKTGGKGDGALMCSDREKHSAEGQPSSSSDDLRKESSSPKVDTKTLGSSEPSPQSIDSEGSQREISLDHVQDLDKNDGEGLSESKSKEIVESNDLKDQDDLSTSKDNVTEIDRSIEHNNGVKISTVASVIDTSIFPGPPPKKAQVVPANCFELDVSGQQTDVSLSFSAQCAGTTVSSRINVTDGYDGSAKFSSNPGPSDDREDISDEEFDEDTPNVSNKIQPILDFDVNHVPPVTDPNSFSTESFVQKSDNVSINSSDAGDIIDLKLEDAALKSIGSSCDTEDNRQSKVSNEDLEAVSDDELPNIPHSSDTAPIKPSTNLLEDREEVSSSEDEDLNKQPNSDILPISSGDEFQNETPDVSEKMHSDPIKPDSEASVRLESLAAEPISDEEDNTMTNDESKQTSFDEGEAGEIKSPALGSPISEQGDLGLGEVEPVSADESADTDGELPSGDEAEKGGDGLSSNLDDKKFESIDSDDDLGGDVQKSDLIYPERGQAEKSPKISVGLKPDSTDMEAISDEENLDGEDSEKKQVIGSNEELSSVSSIRKDSILEKGHIQTSFNEHQVELDYEETYGEDGEAKTDSKEEHAKVDSKQSDGEDGECPDEGLASDKDEGELSDDDCEEGEIKEPGIKRQFFKPICRFFQRGHCTWGINCRFLHPGVNDKGNYQMIETPGFKPVGIRARLGVPGQYVEQPPEEEVELPPPPIPDVPHVETAWERGLRIAKEQRKKASERKEKEPDFEEKRLNLSVDEERELNKENERTPRIIPKDPYYDQQAYEVDEYYKIPRDPWHTGHYENFEVRYHQENSYSPPYREKPPAPPMRYNRPLSPPIDKFGRHREDRPGPEPERHDPFPVSDYPPAATKHPDEWIDPWRRSKSPKHAARKPRSRSRGRRNRRSLSDSSDSSRSNSRSSSGSSRSSRSGSSSSSSRSRSPEPAPPGVDRMDRQDRYGSDQPRSMVSVRGPENHRGGSNRYDGFRYQRGGAQGYDRGDGRNMYKPRQDNFYQGGRGGGGSRGGYYGNNNNYRGGFGGRGGMRGGGNAYNNRDPRARDNRYGRNMSPSRGGRGPTPDRPLPYARPRPKSRSSSRSSSSRSRSRSRSKSSDSSRSRSSSNSSRTSSSSSSSGGSADSDHLYRDLGSPSKAARHPGMTSSQKKRQGMDSRKDRPNAKSNHTAPPGQTATRHPPPPTNLDRIPYPRSPPHSRGDPKYSQIPLPSSGGRSDTKYASRNAPQPPVKAKDPLKVVGQKSNIKLTLLPKQQQQSSLGERPNPLASPPRKRHISDLDSPPPIVPPPNKRPNLSMQASSLRMATEKASKLQTRQEKAKSPPAGSLPPPPSSAMNQRTKNPPLPTSPQKQPTSKARPTTEAISAKPAAKAPPGGPAAPNPAGGAKSKKSMSSRREELLKQLKAVEDAIARKKFKMS